MKFDFSSIPVSANIKKATLSLYSDPHPQSGTTVEANYGDDNSFVVYQVSQNWSPSTVTWHNQPPVNTGNEVVIPSTTLPFLDLNIDVTTMVKSMVSMGENYGFKLQLVNEVAYTSRLFVTSHHPDYPNKYPKFVIEYR